MMQNANRARVHFKTYCWKYCLFTLPCFLINFICFDKMLLLPEIQHFLLEQLIVDGEVIYVPTSNSDAEFEFCFAKNSTSSQHPSSPTSTATEQTTSTAETSTAPPQPPESLEPDSSAADNECSKGKAHQGTTTTPVPETTPEPKTTSPRPFSPEDCPGGTSYKNGNLVVVGGASSFPIGARALFRCAPGFLIGQDKKEVGLQCARDPVTGMGVWKWDGEPEVQGCRKGTYIEANILVSKYVNRKPFDFFPRLSSNYTV